MIPRRGIANGVLQAPFNVKSLFAKGEQGVWYDPSDLSTLFQDSAGTTPVTAVGQPVGKMLDKSGRANHATQATAAARPVLSARVNLALSSEAITVAAGWSVTKFTVTQNAISAPSPYLSSTQLTATAIADNAVYILGAAPQAGTSVNVQIAAHHGSLSSLSFLLRNGTTASQISSATLSSAGVLTANTGGYSVSSLGSGWYLVKLVISSGFTTGNTLQFYGGSTAGIANGSFYHLTGFQFQYGQETRYQRINTSTDYDTAGFPMYLSCDGVDDGMATASIDFSPTDKMTVWTGIRKLSDAAQGVLVELSANASSNAGSFNISAPNSAAANYSIRSGGTTSQTNTITTYTAPISNVITGVLDIGNDGLVVRANGVDVATTTSDQGTGNYGNYPLYLFRRGGTTLPFKGNFYGLIIHGTQSTPKQLSQVEKYLAAKTGVSI